MNHSRTWLCTTVILASVMFAMSQFYRASVAVISPDLMQEMGLNALDLSRISAAFFYAFAVMQIPVGIFLDTVGPRIAMTGINFFTMAGVAVFLQGMGHVMARFFPGASLTLPAFHLAFGLCAACLAGIALLYGLTGETLKK